MAWFFSRRPSRQRQAGRPYSESQRSPGLASLLEMRDKQGIRAVLDLGPSSTESLQFFSSRADAVVIQDAFHSSATSGQRSELFRFASAEDLSLPEQPKKGEQLFDTVLAWDLLHYLPARERATFVARLRLLLAPGALVMITASSVAPIPPSPIHFKILGVDRLEYIFDESNLLRGHGLTTREVEGLMEGFEPIRYFQLRNGYQELVFQLPDGSASASRPNPGPRPRTSPPLSSRGAKSPGTSSGPRPGSRSEAGGMAEKGRGAGRLGGTGRHSRAGSRPGTGSYSKPVPPRRPPVAPGPGTAGLPPKALVPGSDAGRRKGELSESGRHLIVFAGEDDPSKAGRSTDSSSAATTDPHASIEPKATDSGSIADPSEAKAAPSVPEPATRRAAASGGPDSNTGTAPGAVSGPETGARAAKTEAKSESETPTSSDQHPSREPGPASPGPASPGPTSPGPTSPGPTPETRPQAGSPKKGTKPPGKHQGKGSKAKRRRKKRKRR